jgi:hypothetical protein
LVDVLTERVVIVGLVFDVRTGVRALVPFDEEIVLFVLGVLALVDELPNLDELDDSLVEEALLLPII